MLGPVEPGRRVVDVMPWGGTHTAELAKALHPDVRLGVADLAEGNLVFTAERLRNPELAAAFEARHVSSRRAHLLCIVRGAVERGQLPADSDVELLAEVGPAIMLHEFVKGDGKLSRDVVDRVMRQFFA